jgi:hypothetical protein
VPACPVRGGGESAHCAARGDLTYARAERGGGPSPSWSLFVPGLGRAAGSQAGARPLCGHIIRCEWRRTVAVDVSATDEEEAGWRGAALS